MNIRAKFGVVCVGITLLIAIVGYTTVSQSNENLIEVQAVRIADVVSTQVLADRAVYTGDLVGKLRRDGTGASRESQQQKGFIPLPAQFVRTVSQRVKERAGDLYSYSLLSEWNLNPDQGLKDDFDRWAWAQLVEQESSFKAQGIPPGENGYPWRALYRFETIGGRPVLRYLRADPASAQPCVTCHNEFEQRQEVMAGRRSADVAPGKQWQLHDLMGAIKVEIPVEAVGAVAASGRNTTLFGLAAGLLAGFGLLFWFLRKWVIQPVEKSAAFVEAIRAGDYSQRTAFETEDEIGELGDALNQMSEHVRSSLQKLAGSAQSVGSSSEMLNSVSRQLADNAEETSTQVTVVSSASEQVSTHIGMVTTNSEQMAASIREISQSTTNATRVTNEAVGTVQSANTTINRLGDSSAEIGKVINVITSIAEQTNLLALNATIEAARAGEAGKGFAVVANEVKELANQTSQATEEIRERIEAIQADSQGAVAAVDQVTNVINQINEIATSIASAVEEQTATTSEITRSVGEASKGTSEISSNISGVATTAKNTAQGANETLQAAQALSQIADELQEVVRGFKV